MVRPDLVEPREDDPAQRFRIEPFGPPAAERSRIRPVVTDHCLSLRDQEFLIELIPPP